MKFLQILFAATALLPLSLAVALESRTPTAETSLDTRTFGWLTCSSNFIETCERTGGSCSDSCVCTPKAHCSIVKIIECLAKHKVIDSNCNCGSTCSQTCQKDCSDKGGKLDSSSCSCTTSSGSYHKRDVAPRCPPSLTACRLTTTSGRTSLTSKSWYECVDVSADIDSCGGCVTEGQGQDCSAIEGVQTVACEQSKCVVKECELGWEVSEDETSCVEVEVTEGRRGGRKNKPIVLAAMKNAEQFWGL